jgi:hypothetical protein
MYIYIYIYVYVHLNLYFYSLYKHISLTLGHGYTGYCVGYINLPEDSVWTIHFTILRKEKSLSVETDPLRVSIGA